MKQVIVARNDLGMGSGKLAAQVAHAALDAYDGADDDLAEQWRADGQPKIVLRADDAATLQDLHEEARRAGLPRALVRDAGRTQLEPGTLTALAIGPARAEDIDRITGHLSLL